MRIRRRPQAQALVPSPLLHHPSGSDPSTPPSQPPPPADQHHWLSREEGDAEEEKSKSGELHRPNVDLVGDEPSRPPQGNNVEGGRSGSSSSESNPGRGGGGGGVAQRRQAGAADVHGRLENGHGDDHEWPVIDAAGKQRLANGSAKAMPTATLQSREGMKSDAAKRRRGQAVMLEGSRCSRVNGRGWRCSQPTLVGYSLCEHHLGKGRLQSHSASANGGGGRSTGRPKLGRTELASSRKSAVAMALVTVAAAPRANEPLALRHI
uniref:Uncharacterized protein n=1 Tax=Avena sativa TaxID=4498 RepID=A0ACD5YU34_AVESA